MSSLENVLGGPWAPPPEKLVAPPGVQQLIDAMKAAGLEPPDEIHFDGKIHRFRSGTKGSPGHGDKPGWYLVFGDGIPAGRFGCWRAGMEITWRADVGRKLTEFEEMAHARRINESKVLREAAQERQHKVASETVEKIWLSGIAAHPDHPYLKRKGIQTHGVRTTGDGRLMVPLYDADGTLATLQYIDDDGGKLYHPGGQTGGKYWMVGTMDEPGVLYVAEGYATAATIHEATTAGAWWPTAPAIWCR
jgi:putative DNA primase/helicase